MVTVDPIHQPLDGASRITVEVAYATPQRQAIVKLEVNEGTTVEEAIERSGIKAQFPAIDPTAEVGIFSRKVTRHEILKAGDRVEIYRELVIDPKDARREKASVERKVLVPTPRKRGSRRQL